MATEERTVTLIRERTKHLLAGVIVLGYLSAAPDGRPLGRPQGQEPLTFKAGVELVPIRASVRDGRGRPLRGLRQADFEVFDSGTRQRIVTFEADERAPISVAFLIDVSGSMSVADNLSLARATVSRILGSLRSGRDEAALYTFDSALHERQVMTRDLSAVGNAFPVIEPYGNTSLYDAIAATARRVDEQTTARRAIVVITDGIDTSSQLTASEVSGLASSIDLPVYVIAAIAAADRTNLMGDRTVPADGYAADLRHLADWTGGTLLIASSRFEAARQAALLVTELRHQYILGIDAAGASGWRALSVRVRDKSAIVKARSGYFGRAIG
jgi:Ca-activated chloride channel family protein